jgi:hypothetical protein
MECFQIGKRTEEEDQMKSFARLLGVPACLLALVGVADAATTLFSLPILVTNPASSQVVCIASNVSASAQTMQIQAFGGDGALLSDSGLFTVNPGNVARHGVPLDTQYCKFIAGGLAGDVRAGADISNSASGDTAVFPAQ